ncbi:MAG: TlpA disulfide reductase family protein [Pseudomonadota bacterium]
MLTFARALTTFTLWSAALNCWAGTINTGQSAPLFQLPVLAKAKQELALAEYRGKIVYVDFWASWCGPCRKSFPALDVLRKDYNAQGFEVVAISVDDYKDDALGFMEELPVSYPLVWDPTGTVMTAFGVLGMPTGFLLDKNGVVQAVHPGFRDGDAEKLRAEILKLLES